MVNCVSFTNLVLSVSQALARAKWMQVDFALLAPRSGAMVYTLLCCRPVVT